MIVVSGVPRSGTSLMMTCLRQALGEERILGLKYPQIDGVQKALGESNYTKAEQEALIYAHEKYDRLTDEDRKMMRDMNPHGFWECAFTVPGVHWSIGIEEICKPATVCKIVSQGLANTDPKWVDKLLYMVRNPRQVAKSQERLRRAQGLMSWKEEQEEFKVHTPQMFVQVTYQAAKWLMESGYAGPILYVEFDDMLSSPDSAMKRLAEFLGEGDFGDHPVEKRLKRSEPEDVQHELWEAADTMYQLFLEQKHAEIVEYFEARELKLRRESMWVQCTRLDERMAGNECRNCKNSLECRRNFRIRSDRNNIDWPAEPCMYDCVFNPDEPHVTVRESIENNHWRDTL